MRRKPTDARNHWSERTPLKRELSKELDEIVNVQLIVVASVVHALSYNELGFDHRSQTKQTKTQNLKTKLAIPLHFCKGLATFLPMILNLSGAELQCEMRTPNESGK